MQCVFTVSTETFYCQTQTNDAAIIMLLTVRSAHWFMLVILICVCFLPDNRLLDTTYELKSLNLKLCVENEQLRSGSVAPSNGTSAAAAAKISQLESKLLTQQEQLTELHKRKGENAQMIIDLNLKLEKQNKLLGERETT